MRVLLRKDFLCREQAIERCGKASIDGHLHDDFDDFLLGAADVEGSMDVHFELRRGVAQCGERRHHGEFPCLEIEAAPRVDVAKEFNEQPCKVRRNVAQTFNDIFARLTIDFLELCPASQIAFVIHIGFLYVE